MAVAGSGAEIMDKGGAGAENKYFRIRNTEKIITFLKHLHVVFYSLLRAVDSIRIVSKNHWQNV